MARELIRVRLRQDGPVILAEVDADVSAWEGEDAFVTAADPGDALAQAADSIEGALDAVITPTAATVMNHLRQLAPSTVQLEFGLKMSGKAGLVFASAEAEAHLTVSLTWDASQEPPGAG